LIEVALVTCRFERTRRFYVDVLGMQAIDTRSPDNDGSHRKRRAPVVAPTARETLKGHARTADRGVIVLSGYLDGAVDPERASWTEFDGGPCLLALSSGDFDAAFASVDACPDAMVLARPRPVAPLPYGGRRVFSFLGPDGERVEIVEARTRA
jgi:catechol 2,3-dioxygenase-like lactoylglutathione lyase family enzyme